jgi:hypothetical protein
VSRRAAAIKENVACVQIQEPVLDDGVTDTEWVEREVLINRSVALKMSRSNVTQLEETVGLLSLSRFDRDKNS